MILSDDAIVMLLVEPSFRDLDGHHAEVLHMAPQARPR